MPGRKPRTLLQVVLAPRELLRNAPWRPPRVSGEKPEVMEHRLYFSPLCGSRDFDAPMRRVGRRLAPGIGSRATPRARRGRMRAAAATRAPLRVTLLLLTLALFPLSSWGQVVDHSVYQGRLTDGTGASHNFDFHVGRWNPRGPVAEDSLDDV